MATRSNNDMAWAWGLILGISLAITTGCRQYPKHELDTILLDMSPGFETIALSHDQRVLRHARTLNAHQRQLNDDWDVVWLIDRPLHLSVYPIP